MTQVESWTIGRLLQWTTDYLRESKSDTPRLDAEVLLAHARRCTRIELYTDFSTVADEVTRGDFRELVRRRANGMPVAYLVGHREFYSLGFHVTADVLIPRPESEFVVIAALDLIRARSAVAAELTIADVGTGSGILAICLAKQLPNAKITAIDISDKALKIAQKNALDHKVMDRIQFSRNDLLEGAAQGEPFDLIVSNPPYVSSDQYAELPRPIREFEPRIALESGPKGTEVIARLIQQAPAYLKEGGHVVVEMSPMIKSEVERLLVDRARFDQIHVISDLARMPRVITARRHA